MRKYIVTALFISFLIPLNALSPAKNYIYNTYNYNKNSLHIKSNFPIFNKNNNLHLNQIISKKLFFWDTPEGNRRFFKNPDAFLAHIMHLKQTGQIKGIVYYSNAKVVHLNKNILSIRYDTYTMPLKSAHGINNTYAFLISFKTGKILKLYTFIPKNKIKPFTMKSRGLFLSEMKSKGISGYIRPAFLKTFRLPKTWVITGKGIRFIFGQYELGPRFIGLPDFLVSVNVLKSFIKPAVKKLL